MKVLGSLLTLSAHPSGVWILAVRPMLLFVRSLFVVEKTQDAGHSPTWFHGTVGTSKLTATKEKQVIVVQASWGQTLCQDGGTLTGFLFLRTWRWRHYSAVTHQVLLPEKPSVWAHRFQSHHHACVLTPLAAVAVRALPVAGGVIQLVPAALTDVESISQMVHLLERPVISKGRCISRTSGTTSIVTTVVPIFRLMALAAMQITCLKLLPECPSRIVLHSMALVIVPPQTLTFLSSSAGRWR